MSGPVRLLTRSKDIQLSGVSGDVRVQDSNGTVEVRMAKVGSIQLENRKGDIQLYVPENSNFEFRADARDGDIDSDFQQVKVEKPHDNASASGRIGDGGPSVVLRNEHGAVELRKGETLVEAPEAPAAPTAPKAPLKPSSRQLTPTEN